MTKFINSDIPFRINYYYLSINTNRIPRASGDFQKNEKLKQNLNHNPQLLSQTAKDVTYRILLHMKHLHRLCNDIDVLLIADEVVPPKKIDNANGEKLNASADNGGTVQRVLDYSDEIRKLGFNISNARKRKDVFETAKAYAPDIIISVLYPRKERKGKEGNDNMNKVE
jgi:hypothetical protein